MRKILLVLPLLLSASPALAAQDPGTIRLPRELTDPAAQMRLAARLQSISNAIMALKVGEVAAALEGRDATSAERNATLGDVIRAKDPNFDRDVAREVAKVGPKVQQSIQTLSHTLPRVMRDVADAQKSIDRAVANLPDPTYPQR